MRQGEGDRHLFLRRLRKRSQSPTPHDARRFCYLTPLWPKWHATNCLVKNEQMQRENGTLFHRRAEPIVFADPPRAQIRRAGSAGVARIVPQNQSKLICDFFGVAQNRRSRRRRPHRFHRLPMGQMQNPSRKSPLAPRRAIGLCGIRAGRVIPQNSTRAPLRTAFASRLNGRRDPPRSTPRTPCRG